MARWYLLALFTLLADALRLPLQTTAALGGPARQRGRSSSTRLTATTESSSGRGGGGLGGLASSPAASLVAALGDDLRSRGSSAAAGLGQSLNAAPSTGLARVLLVGCAMTYGYGYVNTKQLQQLLQPSVVTTLRFVLAALIFLPSIAANWHQSGPEAVRGGIELGSLCALGFISQGSALQSTSASKVAFFCGLSVIMPPLFSIITGLWGRLVGTGTGTGTGTGNKSGGGAGAGAGAARTELQQQLDAITRTPSLLQRFATSPLIPPLIALLGAAVLEWGSFEAPHIKDLMLLITPISFSLCFWRSERLTRRVPGATAFITGIMLTTCAVISALAALLYGNLPTSLPGLAALGAKLANPAALASLFYQGALATAATSYIEQRALTVLSAADTTLIYSLEPIFASLFAALFLGEHLGLSSAVSALFIISACLYDAAARSVLRGWARRVKAHTAAAAAAAAGRKER